MLRSSRSTTQFAIDFDYDVRSTRLSLHGELDALSDPAFAAVLTELARRSTRTVTIDLSDLQFCNIGGLRAMTELAARLHAAGGRVEILAPSILTRMLELADLRSLFDLPDTDADDAAGRPAGTLRRLATGA